MNKKLSAEQIGILLNINGKIVQLEQAEPGYFNGDFRVGLGCMQSPDIGFHVEAIEINIKKSDTMTIAKNDTYQSVIDNWLIRNDGCAPHLLTVSKKQYFINMETFAR